MLSRHLEVSLRLAVTMARQKHHDQIVVNGGSCFINKAYAMDVPAWMRRMLAQWKEE